MARKLTEKEYQAKYYLEHRDKLRAYKHKYYASHKMDYVRRYQKFAAKRKAEQGELRQATRSAAKAVQA